MSFIAAIAIAQSMAASVWAKPGFYLSDAEFVATVFEGDSGEVSNLIVTRSLRDEIEQILEHPLAGLRLKYWQQDDMTAWILDEIGKTEPITIGVAVAAGRVSSVRILEYRESRGSEVRFPYFTNQFRGAELANGTGLDRRVDGITGATMSVEAVQKVVRVALLLDRYVAADSESARSASY